MSPPSDWSSTEQALWNAVHEGRCLDLAPRSGQLGADDDLREVSASALASLILDPPAASAGVVTHVHLVRARVTGELRLAHADVKVPVSLIYCRFDQPVDLLHLHHARMIGVDAASERHCLRLARTIARNTQARSTS